MKLFKRLSIIIFALVGLVFFTVIMILVIDGLGTSYLKVKKGEASNNSTYLITNVNIIPMNGDNVLVNKMVYIKDGIIKSISETIDIKGIEVFDAKGKYLVHGLIDMHVDVRKVFFLWVS